MPHPQPKRSGGSRLICLFLAFFFGGLCIVVTGCSREPKLELFPTRAYLENPADFLGNSYRLKVQIDSQIRWEKGLGRILAIKPEGDSVRLPVFVPEVQGNNLHVGQRFELRILVEEGGLIYVEELRKY